MLCEPYAEKMSKGPKTKFEVYKACDRASAMLRDAGFILQYVSQKSEACYFGFPGRVGWIRVATHKQNRPPAGLTTPIISKITFNGNNRDGANHISMGEEKFENTVALAIGRYVLKARAAIVKAEDDPC